MLAELAVMMSAGLTPDRAFEEVARRRGPESVAHQIWQQRQRGESLASALRATLTPHSSAWRTLGAAWQVARVSGAPLAPALVSLGEGLRDIERTARAVSAELAAPRATLRLVGLLPLVSLAGGALGGVNTVSFLLGTSVGLFALGGGLALLALAWWWMRLMVHSLISARIPPSPRTDLFLVALGGGVSPSKALRDVDRVMLEWNLEPGRDDELEELIELSMRAGVPLASLARAHLRHAREVESMEATRAVGVLSVHLVLPLGLLVLPAFLLIAVLPLAWGVGSASFAL